MAHWIVLWGDANLGDDIPELDVLKRKACKGEEIATHPGYITTPKRLALAKKPQANVFRPAGYPWVVLATARGRKQLEREHYGIEFMTKHSLPLYCLDPWALHQRVISHNWDEGYDLLYEAMHSPTCDLGTALAMYWMSGAAWLRQYARREDAESHEQESWDFVHSVEQKALDGAFLRGWVYYDPVEEDRFYEDRAHRFVRELPELMFAATGTRPENALPPLHTAVWKGDDDLVAQLLADGANPNEENDDDNLTTPLELALKYKRHSAVAALLKHNVELERCQKFAIVSLRSISLVESLSKRAEVDELFLSSVRRGWLSGAQWLVAHGASVQTKDDFEGANALQLATKAGHLNVARWLLEQGLDVNAEYGDYDRTALEDAAYENFVELSAMLLDHGATKLDSAMTWVLWSSSSGDRPKLELLELLLDRGASAEEALGRACGSAYGDAFDRIMARKPNINSADKHGYTALHRAAARPEEDFRPGVRLSLVKRLLEAGADTTLRSQDGKTPLEFARESGFQKAIVLLM